MLRDTHTEGLKPVSCLLLNRNLYSPSFDKLKLVEYCGREDEDFNCKGLRTEVDIVGLTVSFPGARDSSKLWRPLEDSMNTIEEVCFKTH